MFDRLGYTLVRCKDCGLVFVNPQSPSSETERIYDQEYFAKRDIGGASVDMTTIRSFRRLSAAQHLDDIAKSQQPPGRLLDVGCAEGFFLEVAKASGWECWGVEVSEFAAEVANGSNVGCIFEGKLRDAAYPDG